MLELVDKPTRQQIINRYHKIYVHRHPPKRQVRWCPKIVGRKDQPEIEEVSETCQSRPLEQIEGVNAIDNADRCGGHSRKLDCGFCMAVKAVTAGVDATLSNGQAKCETQRAEDGIPGHIATA